MIRLVGRRSVLRFLLSSPIFLSFAWGAIFLDLSSFVRLGVGLMAMVACVDAVTFWWLVRRWRIDRDLVHVPILRDRDRCMSTAALAKSRLFDGGVVRFAHGLEGDALPGGGQLAINVFVSTHDFKEWLDAARRQVA